MWSDFANLESNNNNNFKELIIKYRKEKLNFNYIFNYVVFSGQGNNYSIYIVC